MPDVNPGAGQFSPSPAQAGAGEITPYQAALLWKGADPRSPVALTTVMVAIAGAESAYKLRADNGIAAGIWQVNYHAHPEWTAQQLYDGRTNAHAAYSVYRSQGLGAWDTYTSGAYRQFLPQAKQAARVAGNFEPVAGPVAGAAAAAGKAAWSAASAVPTFLGDLGSLLFTQKGWMRLLKLFAGVALGIIALHSLFKDTAVYKAGKDAATAVAA